MESLEEPRRILAIDLGKKRVGLAVSDPTGIFAVGLETLILHRKLDLLAELETLCRQYSIEKIILGLPVNMNGTEGTKAQEIREFAQALAERLPSIPIMFLDERLTSVLAHQTLQAQGISPSRNRELVDQAAAKRILQDYLDRETIRKQTE
jgi:putative holliday junction resolvase